MPPKGNHGEQKVAEDPQEDRSLLVAELPLSALDRFQRLDTIARLEGFMPVSPTEQVEAIGLLSVIGTPGGAAKHLAEVARQQKKAGVEVTDRAPIRITRDFIDYAKDAKNSAIGLKQLQSELTEVLNPELILDVVIKLEQPGLLEFLRFQDLSLLRQTGDTWKVGYDPQSFVYSRNNPAVMFYLKEAMAKWTVRQVKKGLPDAVADQTARFRFFSKRLVEIDRHSSRRVAAVARGGLDELYERNRPETTNNEHPQTA